MKNAPKIIKLLHIYGPLIQALSLLFVVVTILYTHRETGILAEQLRDSRVANKRAYTFDLLSDLSENDAIAEANYAMVQLINSGALVSADQQGKPIISNSKKIKKRSGVTPQLDDRNLVALLNFYELIATAYAHDAVDKNLIIEVRGGPMRRAHDLCQEYILQKRKLLDAPKLYSNFSNLVADVKARPDKR